MNVRSAYRVDRRRARVFRPTLDRALVQPVDSLVQPVPVSDTIFDRVRADILSGTLAPGDPLPGERQLAEELGVNRHGIREAVKRLQQAGLVRVSHGGATRVLDWRDHG